MPPTIMLATLCLNEMEWLPKLYEQHKDWPGLVGWCFVEAADKVYAETNPDMVREGTSVDGTSKFLRDLAERDNRVTWLPYGVSKHNDPAQGKCEARQRYLDVAEKVKPDILWVLDADEFYCHGDQRRIMSLLDPLPKEETAFMFRQRHIWYPPSLQDNDFKLPMDSEVVGGYWSIPHCRGWRWLPGLRYSMNHNWPDRDGKYLTESMARFNRVPNMPECVHMGYASSLKTRQAKHQYYVARGEGRETHRNRSMYVDCRAAWERWKPGDGLPHGAGVRAYNGPIPECFR